MTKEEYEKRIESLLQQVRDRLNESGLSELEISSLNRLIEIMDEYTFENRLEVKGMVSRLIIDSFQLDYSICERFIQFDNSIR